MTAELPLNWQDDPIYFDSGVSPVNEWLNANELVTNNRIDDIFLGDKKTLNLYPLMVRRSDFIREKPTDRILARFPYVQLTVEEKEIINGQELLIAEKLRDYFYKSDNRRILEWRDILQKDMDRGFVPLPFLRCFPKELKFDFHNRSFESARGEAFTMPLQLTEEIAYLSSMVNGDGV